MFFKSIYFEGMLQKTQAAPTPSPFDVGSQNYKLTKCNPVNLSHLILKTFRSHPNHQQPTPTPEFIMQLYLITWPRARGPAYASTQSTTIVGQMRDGVGALSASSNIFLRYTFSSFPLAAYSPSSLLRSFVMLACQSAAHLDTNQNPAEQS